MLELDHLDIRQGDFRLQADLAIEEGARVAVIGPSGGGKSTLIGAIAGFVAHVGEIRWQGARIDPSPPPLARSASSFRITTCCRI
jgi:thiamine transport system ATP-binding protein